MKAQFGEPVSGNNENSCEKVLRPKELPMGEPQPFIYLNTVTGLGQDKSGVLHVFHPASIDSKEELSFDSTTKIGVWGCKVLNENIAKADPEKGRAVLLTLKPTPKDKRYINIQVQVGPLAEL